MTQQPQIPPYMMIPTDFTVKPDMPFVWHAAPFPQAGQIVLFVRDPNVVMGIPMNPAAARRLAAQLMDAADEAEGGIVQVHSPIFGPNGEVIG